MTSFKALNLFTLVSLDRDPLCVQGMYQVLLWLLENQLFVKDKKCEF